MGGGNFVVPAQTVPDFLDNKLSGNDKVLHVVACQQSAPNVGSCLRNNSTTIKLPLGCSRVKTS